jgi:hypothetical protein
MFTKILIANRGFIFANEVKQSSRAVPLDCRVATYLAMTELGEVACV